MSGISHGRRTRGPRPGGARLALLGLAGLLAAGCEPQLQLTRPAPAPRTYRMGFSALPPRGDSALVLLSLETWTRRADAAIIHLEPPWDSLLAGVPADTLVRQAHLGLVRYYRGKGLRIWITLDATNGIDRQTESEALLRNGRSLTEPAVQRLYRNYAVALDTLLRPDHLGLAAETNLIRAVAPAQLYAAVKQVANAAAADVRAVDAGVDLYVSVQAEVAWGRLWGTTAPYAGIAQDLADFPFIQSLGISSYPYLRWPSPDSLPTDYYARLASGRSLPLAVVEGGWTSASVESVASTPAVQARYIARQAALLDAAHAIGVFQLAFTDLDLSSSTSSSGLSRFASLGLADASLAPKPSLAVWDSTFARPFAR